MGKLKQAILLSFRAKVLLPVLGVMVLLMAVSMGLVYQRFTHLAEEAAAQQIATAEAAMKSSQQIRARHLESRFRSALSEPRWKALALLLESPDGELSDEAQRTIRGTLDDLLGENLADAIVLATSRGKCVTVTRNPELATRSLEAACATSIEQAAAGWTTVDIVRNGEQLYDIVTVPVHTGESRDLVGSVTFGVRNAIVQEFSQLAQSDLVLFFNGEAVASSLPAVKLRGLLDDQKAKLRSVGQVGQLTLHDEPFLSLGGQLNSRTGEGGLSYMILSSLEKPLRELRDTQRLILGVGVLALLVAGAAMWIFVRRVTGPLEELRTSVEAVGRGDFLRRIEVRSNDECGELAEVFNQMTENLKQSREQLETTVESLKTTQAQLIQSEKLSGIGEFVAGVAHELNNPLTTVMGFSELLQHAEVESKHKRHLEMVHKSALRCQKIVQSLLSFARRHQPEKKLVCVNRLVEASVEFLAYQMRTSNIEVQTQLDPHLPQAMVDQHQIQQVFVNILNNGRQAVEAHCPKGWVRVTSDTVGGNVRIVFQDSGPGIPEANLSKVFDPFFTTKEVGTGTGLGLSLCYGIVKEHGGSIQVRSRRGEGATFIVELPIAAPAEGAAEETPQAFFTKPASREGAGKRVLVIDDEEPILQMLSDALGECGYAVDTESNGEAALQRLARTDYDLTLCDWKMPGLNGRQIYERLQTVNPAMSERMIFITGDVINERTQKFLQEENKRCLGKPFSLEDFRTAVSQATTTKA